MKELIDKFRKDFSSTNRPLTKVTFSRLVGVSRTTLDRMEGSLAGNITLHTKNLYTLLDCCWKILNNEEKQGALAEFKERREDIPF